MKKRIIKILSFIVVLWIVLACANHVFRFKYINGVLNTELFYEEEKDSIDVLIMGSSHAWAAIDPSILWEKYGIAAYDMGGPEQPIWCSYYYLKEALKYQSPQLLVLEAYSLTEESDVATPMQITRNINGMRWSINKLQCLLESVKQEEFLDYCFEYVQYHSRYKEIERKDFTTNYGSVLYDHYKGFYGREETVAFEMNDVKGITERESLLEKNEEYYRRIIELAQENAIQVCVVVSPYAGITETHKMKYNTVEDIADEYGIPFIDYNEVYNEIGMDFAADHADEGHMNYKGVRKFTDYFADYIRDEYSLMDHRNKEFFASWDDNAYFMDAFYESMYIKDSMTWNDWIANISTSKNLDMNFIVSIEGACDKENPKLQKLFDEIKISEAKESSLWICEDGMPVVIGSDWEYRDWGVDTFKIRSGQDGANSIFMNRNEVNKVDNGVNIIIYSNTLEKVVDVVGIDCGNGYQLVR